MGRKLTQPERTKAIVNFAWDAVKADNGGIAPPWNYIAVCAIVDDILTSNNIEDGRDLCDAIVLCSEMDMTPTKKNLVANMARVVKGRNLGTAVYK